MNISNWLVPFYAVAGVITGVNAEFRRGWQMWICQMRSYGKLQSTLSCLLMLESLGEIEAGQFNRC